MEQKTPEILLKMLASGRGDLAYYHNLGIMHQAKKSGMLNKIKVNTLVLREYNH